MKTLKFVTITLIFLNLLSCKNNQENTNTVTIETIEEVKKSMIPENAILAKAEFNIEGMTCAIGCAAKIEKSLSNMDGIKTAKVDFENKIATVEYDMAQVNEKKLKNRVIENGTHFKVANFKETL
jgi:Cu+-exporting ATPase